MIKSFLIAAILCIYTLSLKAQIQSFTLSSNVLYNDGYGIPWNAELPYRIEGSPFFDKGFCKGSIQLLNGKTYGDLQLKLNLEEQKVIFTGADGKTFAVSQPLARVELACNNQSESIIFRSGFGAVNKQNEQSLYQVLDSGRVLLLKFVEIRHMDSKAYNSTETTRSYRQLPYYYLWKSGKDLIKVPVDENGLLDILKDKKKELAETINNERLKIKKEADLIQVIKKYNSLL